MIGWVSGAATPYGTRGVRVSGTSDFWCERFGRMGGGDECWERRNGYIKLLRRLLTSLLLVKRTYQIQYVISKRKESFTRVYLSFTFLTKQNPPLAIVVLIFLILILIVENAPTPSSVRYLVLVQRFDNSPSRTKNSVTNNGYHREKKRQICLCRVYPQRRTFAPRYQV